MFFTGMFQVIWDVSFEVNKGEIVSPDWCQWSWEIYNFKNDLWYFET